MPDLRVDYDLLSQTEKTLSTLHGELSNCEAQVGAYDSDWGSDDVRNAMGSFTSNWETHRKKLLSSMEATGQLVSTSLETFRRVDQKLAADLTTQPAAQPAGK